MSRVLLLWENLRSSLWFLPALIVAFSIGLAVACVEWSAHLDPEQTILWPRLYASGAAGARGTLQAIGSSMITVAGVVFSITIAALSQASMQYTPRILRHFMRDRWNQTVLGVFLGIFTYCLIVLRTIRGGDEGLFVPSLAVIVALALALVGIGFLIFFIHHVADSLQASTIVASAAKETLAAADHLFPEELGKGPEEVGEGELADALTEDLGGWRPVPAARTGYIQSVSEYRLLRFARENDTVIRMERAIGEYVVEGEPLISVGREGAVSPDECETLNGLFGVNAHRTVEQDTAFGIQQIVDIALKALSPGVNDTTTAIVCLDHLTAVFGRLAGRWFPARRRLEDGRLRVLAKTAGFEGLLALAFGPIRRNAEDNVSVLQRMLDALQTIGGMTESTARRREVARHAGFIADAARRGVTAPEDRDEIVVRAGQVVWRLTKGQGQPPTSSTGRGNEG